MAHSLNLRAGLGALAVAALAFPQGCGPATVVEPPFSDSGEADSGTATTDAGADAGNDAGQVSDAGTPDGGSPDAGPPGIRIIGRANESNPLEPIYSWSGTSISARFTGTSVAALLIDNGNLFDVIIDGTVLTPPLTTSGLKPYTLATGLADGTHDLLLYRRSEAFFGDTQLMGWMFDPGRGLLAPPAPADRRLELIGDSISCGYGDEGIGPNCTFTAATENHYLSYGALTARALSAELTTVAVSGHGMYRNYDGTMTGLLPQVFPLTSYNDTTPWDFATWTPDAALINLGTNDFAQGDPGQPFVDAYLAFVRVLRAKYPQALIVCLVGPMLSGASLTTARTYIQTDVVAAMNTSGDSRVAYVELAAQDGTLGYGCDYHPSLAEHQKMATALTAQLKTLLGW